MKVTREKTEAHQAYLTIEIDPEEMEKSLGEAYKRLVQKARIPGFRKGKAPRHIVERYLGKDSLFEEAIDHLVPDVYEQAVIEQAIEPIAQPHLEVTQTEPVIVKAIVPLRPVITVGEFRTIKIDHKPIEFSDAQVDEVLEQMRHQNATWEPADKAVAYQDLVTIKVVSTVEDKPYIDQDDVQYQVVKDHPVPFPGFGEHLIGVKKGEEKEFTQKLPDDYSNKEFAGKDAATKVTLKEIKVEKLPELNDDFVKLVSSDLQTLDALREQIGTELKRRTDDRNRSDFEGTLIDSLVEMSKIEFPQVMIESEITRIVSQQFQNKRESLDRYLKLSNKTEEQLREELKPSAERGVKRALVLNQLSLDEKVEVSEDEINAEIETMVRDSSDENKKKLVEYFNTADVKESIKNTLLTRKTFKMLEDAAAANGAGEAKAENAEEKEKTEPAKATKAKRKKEDK